MSQSSMTQGKELQNVRVVSEHMQRASVFAGNSHALRFYDNLTCVMEHLGLESPLEAIFWVWWRAVCDESKGERIGLRCQVPVDVDGRQFRLDFVVEPVGVDKDRIATVFPKIAIEVDGHGFHEKTPEQVAERNTRDRMLQNSGWKVFHYSWTEVTERPRASANEVAEYAIKAWWDCLRTLQGEQDENGVVA